MYMYLYLYMNMYKKQSTSNHPHISLSRPPYDQAAIPLRPSQAVKKLGLIQAINAGASGPVWLTRGKASNRASRRHNTSEDPLGTPA